MNQLFNMYIVWFFLHNTSCLFDISIFFIYIKICKQVCDITLLLKITLDKTSAIEMHYFAPRSFLAAVNCLQCALTLFTKAAFSDHYIVRRDCLALNYIYTYLNNIEWVRSRTNVLRSLIVWHIGSYSVQP